ncbi:MAG: exosortase N [Bacteroidales bacterium]|nr:exosortase N [Bacteroidales bacterium]
MINKKSLIGMINSQQYFNNKLPNFLSWLIRDNQKFGFVIALLTLLLAIPKFNTFGGLRFEQSLFFLVLPFTLTKKGRGYNPLLFGFVSAIFMIAFYLTNVFSLFYFGVCNAILACLCFTQYRPGLLSFGLGLITTPAIKYLLSVFSFPLRLELTKVAGLLLSPFMKDISVVGNCINVKNVAFTVVPECLGLNMISSALVFAVFVLAFFANRFKKRPGTPFIIVFMLIALLLVVLTNLNRIILTVVLQAMPGNTLHELIGILLFVLNCCIPLLIIGFYSQRFYTLQNTRSNTIQKKLMISIVLFPLLVTGSYGIRANVLHSKFDSTSVSLEGFQKSESKDGVLKFINSSALVYVKPPAFMLGSDHNPFICWRGSGYEIKNESIRYLGTHSVYTFELHKQDTAPLYSCWWYSNGSKHSISQMEWRMATIRGEKPFCLINVTTDSKEETSALTRQLMTMGISSKIFTLNY